MKFYILCKNEFVNISKCIESLLKAGMDIYVYDSGSVDGTIELIRGYPVTLVPYNYSNHCDAYNDITLNEKEEYCGILDADMELNIELAEEIELTKIKGNVIISPVQMYVEGQPLEKGSLYPPKPIVFKSGKKYFESVGHGERLLKNVSCVHTKNKLIHNDLKPYLSYLGTQVRYASNFIQRSEQKQLTWRDKIRLSSPLLIAITPLYSLFIKGGIFSKKGWIYALDRLVAEAIMYRTSLLKKTSSKINN